jgi:hypothetical protein
MSSLVWKGGFSSVLGQARPRPGKLALRSPVLSAPFQAARSEAISFYNLVGQPRLPWPRRWARLSR